MHTQTGTKNFKAWNKSPFLQAFIIENKGKTPRQVAALLYSQIMSGAIDADDATECLEYATRHMWPTAIAKLETRSEKRKKAAVQKRRKAAQNEQTAEAVRQGHERFAALIMSMTGKQARALQNAPKDTFSMVGDNQLVGDVLSERAVKTIVKTILA